MYQENAQILWNRMVNKSHYRMGLKCRKRYSAANPGQFVMLRFSGLITPFLPRPFSIHRMIIKNDQFVGIEILYKVVGKGTKKMSELGKGDEIDLFGPLGKGFSISDEHQRIHMVAGGIGVAPMLFLALTLKEKGKNLSQCTMFLGGRSGDDLLCRDKFLDSGMMVHVTTDDGSSGDACLVTHPFEVEIKKHRPDIVYACGPVGMLKCVAGIAEKYDILCQVSVETMMACGMGVCLGCAIEPKEESECYMHACVDGPVFDAGKIIF